MYCVKERSWAVVGAFENKHTCAYSCPGPLDFNPYNAKATFIQSKRTPIFENKLNPIMLVLSNEYQQMSTHVPKFQSFFRFFASFCISQISQQQYKGQGDRWSLGIYALDLPIKARHHKSQNFLSLKRSCTGYPLIEGVTEDSFKLVALYIDQCFKGELPWFEIFPCCTSHVDLPHGYSLSVYS